MSGAIKSAMKMIKDKKRERKKERKKKKAPEAIELLFGNLACNSDDGTFFHFSLIHSRRIEHRNRRVSGGWGVKSVHLF